MFELAKLPYKYNALESYIDKETMIIHHDKHHAGYVNNLNDILKEHEDIADMDIGDIIKNLNKIPEDIRTEEWSILKPGGMWSIGTKFQNYSRKRLKSTDSVLQLLHLSSL